jgi:DNA-binding CsgD family transcriptional regulator
MRALSKSIVQKDARHGPRLSKEKARQFKIMFQHQDWLTERELQILKLRTHPIHPKTEEEIGDQFQIEQQSVSRCLSYAWNRVQQNLQRIKQNLEPILPGKKGRVNISERTKKRLEIMLNRPEWLTDREIQALDLRLANKTVKQIANKLKISKPSVSIFIRNGYRRVQENFKREEKGLPPIFPFQKRNQVDHNFSERQKKFYNRGSNGNGENSSFPKPGAKRSYSR